MENHNCSEGTLHDYNHCMRGLERQGKATQHNRKTKQHNTTRPRQLFFKEKLAALGGIRTHDMYIVHVRAVPEQLGKQCTLFCED